VPYYTGVCIGWVFLSYALSQYVIGRRKSVVECHSYAKATVTFPVTERRCLLTSAELLVVGDEGTVV